VTAFEPWIHLERPPAFLQGEVVPPGEVADVADRVLDWHGQRIEIAGDADMFERLVVAAARRLTVGVPVAGGREPGAELDGGPPFQIRPFPAGSSRNRPNS
jgi:hypothetical protein